MPLASWHFFHRYGRDMVSMVAEPGLGELAVGIPSQRIRAAVIGSGVGAAEMRPYRGQTAALLSSGSGSMLAGPKTRMKAALLVSVNTLGQDDVTGAVLEAPIDGGLSLRQAIRLLLAQAAGKSVVSDLGGGNKQVRFRNMDDTADRITATVNSTGRTAVTRNAT